MDGGGGEEGKQEQHLVLAHKLFLLSHPDVDDLSKVALRSDVLSAVKSDDMAPLFESLAAAGVLEPDVGLLAEMRARIDEEIRKLDEKASDLRRHEDPRPWLNRFEQFFKEQRTMEEEEWLASHHLTGNAALWYTRGADMAKFC